MDANVWFSAARSQQGGSFLIMQFAKKKLLTVCANHYVLQEAERNLILKSPQSLRHYYSLRSEISPVMVSSDVPSEFRRKFAKLIPLNDLPVVAGALESRAEYLVTLDRRDLANDRVRKLPLPFLIVTPGDFLENARSAE